MGDAEPGRNENAFRIRTNPEEVTYVFRVICAGQTPTAQTGRAWEIVSYTIKHFHRSVDGVQLAKSHGVHWWMRLWRDTIRVEE